MHMHYPLSPYMYYDTRTHVYIQSALHDAPLSTSLYTDAPPTMFTALSGGVLLSKPNPLLSHLSVHIQTSLM